MPEYCKEDRPGCSVEDAQPGLIDLARYHLWIVGTLLGQQGSGAQQSDFWNNPVFYVCRSHSHMVHIVINFLIRWCRRRGEIL